MEPRVSKREKKLHLSYELPRRIRCSQIYPLIAPNGSTVIFYGHDRGVRILWRGGRRPKEQTTASHAQQTNGVGKSQDVIVIDDSDDEAQPKQAEPESNYEQEEDEQDPDCPYPSIVSDVDIDLGAEVLHLAVPAINSSATSQTPEFARKNVMVALATSNGGVTLMSIPLAPPKPANKQYFIEEEITELQLEGDGSIARGLSVRLATNDDEHKALSQSSGADGRLLVAAAGQSLHVWSIGLGTDSIAASPNGTTPTMHSSLSGTAVAFRPSPRYNQLLFTDRQGAVRIYDSSPSSSIARPSSRDSASVSIPASTQNSGKWVMAYHTPFLSPKDSSTLARRKKILDASWVLGARGILVLLEDGEWGIWDVTGATQTGKGVEDFALRGYLGSSSTPDTTVSRKQRKGVSKLAPMTPNTRKAKAENLFSGPPKPPGVAATGGINVATSVTRSGQVDESVVMWYGSDIYSIPSTQAFWQRSTSNSSGTGGFGSLYAPGLTHVSDINLMNENITSISQFASESITSALGKMNVQRDFFVSAEHRFVILQSLRPSAPHRDLFQQAPELPTLRDQRMLDAGDLDLGGMDRMLDSLAGDARTRKVGFAQ